MSEHCTLCQGTFLNPVLQDYFICQTCDLIFLNPEKHLSLKLEKARYLLHQGQNPEGHLNFLKPVADYVLDCCVQQSAILDFGCGPDQVLAKFFNSKGFKVKSFDPIFFPEGLDLSNKNEKFNLVIATEVFEHFYNPEQEINKLVSLLTASGKILVMTSFHQGTSHFEKWSYRRDPTHVSFYSSKTIDWIAGKHGLVIEKFEMPNFTVLGQ